jgi:hypothetical protein
VPGDRFAEYRAREDQWVEPDAGADTCRVTGDLRGDQGEPGLSVAGARALLGRVGVRSGDVRVSLVKRHNHVWCIGTPGGAYFVKAWTKDWYDWADTLTTGALNADHEAAAYQLLAAHGLAVPEVVAVDQTAGSASCATTCTAGPRSGR